MNNIGNSLIKSLRKLVNFNISIKDCKEALINADGDVEEALVWLQIWARLGEIKEIKEKSVPYDWYEFKEYMADFKDKQNE